MGNERKLWFFNILHDVENFHEKFQISFNSRRVEIYENIIYLQYALQGEIITGVIQFQKEKNPRTCKEWFIEFTHMNFEGEIIKAEKISAVVNIQQITSLCGSKIFFKFGYRRVGGEALIKSDSPMGRHMIYSLLCGEPIEHIYNNVPKEDRHKIDFPELQKAVEFYKLMNIHIETADETRIYAI